MLWFFNSKENHFWKLSEVEFVATKYLQKSMEAEKRSETEDATGGSTNP